MPPVQFPIDPMSIVLAVSVAGAIVLSVWIAAKIALGNRK